MKTAIHPKWNHQAVVTCACGNTFETGSILEDIRVDICGACHPFYTGSMKFVDVQGRVDRFMKMRAAAQQTTAGKKKSDAGSKAPQKSLRELLEEEKDRLKKTE